MARRSTVLLAVFFLAFSAPSLVRPSADGHRINPLTLSATVSSPSLAEGDSGTTNMVFTLTRASTPPGDQSAFSVNYITEDGTAFAGTDYTLTAGTIQFAAGQNTANVNVPILGNRVLQNNRAFTLRVTNTAGAPGFLPQTTFATGTAPNSVASADINGDGRPDIITANRDGQTLSVRLNTTANGATPPTFSAQTTVQTDSLDPTAVTTADINGDGRPDVIFTNETITNQSTYIITVLLNTTPPNATTPSFSARTNFTVGVQPNSVAAADFNGDNRPDIVTANAGGDTLTVRLNTTTTGATTPTFSAATTLANGIQPFSVATADVNLDDRPDLLVSNIGSNNFTARLNTTTTGATTPTFSTPVSFATGFLPVFITVQDINNDNRPDALVASQNSDRLSVFINLTPFNGTTPSFGPETSFPSNGPSAVAVGDINGDGRPEVVTTSRFANHVALFINDSSAGDLVPSFLPATTFATGNRPVALLLADINADNRLDAVSANQDSNTFSVLTNNNNGQGASTTGIGTILDDDTPTAVLAVAGTPQSATVNTAFSIPLTVEARNAAGNPVQGVFVTFTAPNSGASGTFQVPGGGIQFTGSTGADGRLAAATFTANGVTGGYAVTARATSGTNPTATFSLTNTSGSTAPTVTRFYPLAATTGRTVTVTGTGFVPGNTQVFFGGTRLIPTTVLPGGTSTQIQVTVPASTTSANINGYLSIRVGATTIDTQSLPVNAANPALPDSTFPEFVLWGDVNGDGGFTGIDITVARAMFLGQVAGPTSRQRLAVDVSPANTNGSRGDGTFAGIDITLLRALFLGQLPF